MAFSLSSTTPQTLTKPFSPLPFFSPHLRKTQISSSRKLSNLRLLRVTAPSNTITSSEEEEEVPTFLNDVVSPDSEETEESSKFTWRDHWYPVSLLEDLDSRVPTPFQLLGRDIVLWFNKSANQWVAFDDKCPHRLAPLSVRIWQYLDIILIIVSFIEVGIWNFHFWSILEWLIPFLNLILGCWWCGFWCFCYFMCWVGRKDRWEWWSAMFVSWVVFWWVWVVYPDPSGEIGRTGSSSREVC